jgi:hypothetical protein
MSDTQKISVFTQIGPMGETIYSVLLNGNLITTDYSESLALLAARRFLAGAQSDLDRVINASRQMNPPTGTRRNGRFWQRSTCTITVMVRHTTARGLMRRARQLSREYAIYADNWAGWLPARVAIASDNDELGCNGQWCDPANGWLDLSN